MKKFETRTGATLCSSMRPRSATTLWLKFKLLAFAFMALLSVNQVWGSYNLVEATLSDWRGDYLIAYSSTVFMDGSLAGGTSGVGKAQTHVSPGSALSGNTITDAWGDEHYVTIEAIDDNDLSKGYVIKSHSTTTPYFYQTSNANGMACTATKNTAANYPITITFNSSSNISLALGGSAAGAVLHYNTNTGSSGEMFRYYKNGGQSAIYLYKKAPSTYTVNYSGQKSGHFQPS